MISAHCLITVQVNLYQKLLMPELRFIPDSLSNQVQTQKPSLQMRVISTDPISTLLPQLPNNQLLAF